MAFKLAIADYKYLLLQMPPQLNSDDLRNKHFNEKKELNSLLSACNTAFIITEGLLLPNDLVVTSWRNILETHRHYLQGTRKSEELIMYCDAILRQKFIFT